jgi:hypothetical protein
MIGVPQIIKPRRYRSWAPGTVAPTIDWSNPLTRGLRCLLWPQGKNLIDLVKPRPFSTSGSVTSNATIKPRGAAVAGQWIIGAAADSTDLDWTSGSFSCAGFMNFPTPAATQSGVISRGVYVSESNNQGWALYQDAMGTFYNFDVYRNNGQALYEVISTTVVSAGERFVGGMSDGTSLSVIIDGKIETTTSGINVAPVSASTPLASNVTSSGDGLASLYVGFVWLRDLSAAEWWSLYTDPYQFLIFPEDILSSMLVGVVAGGATQQGAAGFKGAGSITALATLLEAASANLAGAGSVVAPATLREAGIASLEGAGALAANATLLEAASASLEGAGTFTALALTPQQFGVATFAGAGILSANAQVLAAAQAALEGAGSFTDKAVLLEAAQAAFAGAGAFTDSGQAVLFEAAQAAFEGAGVIAANATVVSSSTTKQGQANWEGAASFVDNAVLLEASQANFAGAGALTDSGKAVLLEAGKAAFEGSGNLTDGGQAVLLEASQANFEGAGSLTDSGQAVVYAAAQANLAGAGSLAANGVDVVPGATTWQGGAVFGGAASLASNAAVISPVPVQIVRGGIWYDDWEGNEDRKRRRAARLEEMRREIGLILPAVAPPAVQPIARTPRILPAKPPISLPPASLPPVVTPGLSAKAEENITREIVREFTVAGAVIARQKQVAVLMARRRDEELLLLLSA